jgi:ubiquinone/menaquinone biosynthesis C-methylase UbiE
MFIENIIKMFPFLNNENFRRIWVKGQLKNIPKNQTILDAGAGECQYKKYCSHLKYTSQDFGQYDGRGNKIGLQTKNWDNSKLDIISDIADMPIPDNSFDNILCTEVLEHIPYPEKAIAEFSRILKSGGNLMLTAPFCSQTHFAPYHFCTGFNIYWYREILAKNNFEIRSHEINGNYFDYINQELLRIPFVIKKYTFFGILGFLLYIIILPSVLLLYLISLVSKETEKQLCFGYHILAKKKI